MNEKVLRAILVRIFQKYDCFTGDGFLADEVITELKKGDLFIHFGEILPIQEVDYQGSDDGYSTYTIYTNDEEEEDD